jgi:uncharacterized protein YkwD
MIASFILCAALLGQVPLSAQPGPSCSVSCQAALYGAAFGSASTAVPAPTGQPKIELVSVEKDVVERTNAERTRLGLSPLQVDEGLMESAREHARWMTRNHTLRHTSAPVAENIAMGQQDSQQALASWMGSSGHRANILNPSHRRIGVAAFQAASGTIFWCQQFRP